KEIYLARCSEPVVNQVSMIKRFSGGGQVLSFYAPYRCDACSAAFERLVDCEHDAQAISAGEPPAPQCPRCAAAGHFAHDALPCLGCAAPHAGPPARRAAGGVPAELWGLDAVGGVEAIEKPVEGRDPRVKVNARLDNQLRWNRVLDGLEGQVVFDLGSS